LGDRVRFVGSVANTLPYVLAADLFLLPSREDPFPLVCLEAADCGVPTVCFADAGGMPAFVGEEGGAVVPCLDVQAMAKQAIQLLTNRDLLRSAGESARQKVRARYDVSVKGQDILGVLKEVCGL
jgi:glycosyltransferase involved in cell wall biosynthesis